MLNNLKYFISVKTLTILFMLICSQGYAQNQFKWYISKNANNSERADYIIRTTDGGYAVAGWTGPFGGAGSNDAYIVKISASGTLQWGTDIGGASYDFAVSVIQTTDGGYAFAGRTASFGAGNNDFFIGKLDSNGTLQWSRTIGGPNIDEASIILQTPDGGYIVCGWTNSFGAGLSDMYIVKLNAGGTLQWARTVGGTGNDYAWSITQTADGGYVAAGSTNSFGAGADDFFIVKLDSGGTLQWSRTVGGTSGDVANSIKQIIDGGYVVAGSTNSFGAGLSDMYIVKLNAGGTLQWTRTVGGTNWDFGATMIQTTDSGYAVASRTASFGAGGYDIYVVKLNTGGTLQWSRTVGGTNWESANSIIQTTDGGFVTAGYIESDDMYIIKYDGSGNTCGGFTSPASISGTGGTLGIPTPIVTATTPVMTTPTPTTTSGGTLTTVCTVTGIQPSSNKIPQDYSLSQNYPNPFNPVTQISYSLPEKGFVSLKIYNAIGKEVAVLINNERTAGNYKVEFNGANLPSGLYFYRLNTDNYSETKKMILVK